MEMRIKLTSPLICKKHSVLLQNKYRKKDYTSEKNESLQMNHDFNPMGTPSDEPPTNFENDNSFGIGGFETDFSESGLPIDDNIEDISSNSESEMEEFPYQIVPKKDIKTQIQFCKDNICDFKVDLSIYNVFDPNWNNINNETPNTNYSEQPRLLYENFLKSKNLQKDLFEWKLKSNTPSVHFKDLMKILQHYHPEEKLLCTPRVIRKQVPIYDLKTRLPFISELLHLQQTKELFGKKVFIRLCSIAGDTVEQQPASGKTYIESLSGNLDILIKLYPWVNVPLDPLGNKLNAIEVLDLSMILNIAIELTEYGYFESKIQEFEIEKIQIELDKQTDKRNLTQKEIKDENEKRYKKLFKNKRDQLILDIFREKNHLTLVNDFSNWKTEYFDQVPINNKLKVILDWIDLFNSLISNLFLPSRNKNDDDLLEKKCNDFRFIHLKLCNFKDLPGSSHNFIEDETNKKKKIEFL
ncbi:hypothetical protein M0812_11385 [Anaeramoeba flamelloides]|uniref:Uncharacterized protein n=1 Tax=Anaeramoeba flamelloides TaxID=1746091 RepID=A0AAV7ZU20_9EUKA|nr:hypothetical protein M0812_11385 [Anaeramoeba flamelloides]